VGVAQHAGECGFGSFCKGSITSRSGPVRGLQETLAVPPTGQSKARLPGAVGARRRAGDLSPGGRWSLVTGK
jgi:hypothetical protein